ncbi:MAG TPA: transposase [Vicinamibacterales bacterium]|jgi:REP element-mobilizing transposase RayT
MARYKRIREQGLLRHVMSRGNGRMGIFLDDTDYRKFLYILGDVLDEYDVDCWDACVMPNHYHLALMNRRPNLGEAMKHLNGEYATWWNAHHGRVGHVFQGRYKDQIVQRESYLRNLLVYVALNPVRAGLVTSPELWPWSSYRCTAGLSPNPGFLRIEPVLAVFGDGPEDVLRDRYVRHVRGGLPEDDTSYKDFRSRQRILGDRQFKLEVRQRLAPRAEVSISVEPAASAGG